jgi:hypothetical protein
MTPTRRTVLFILTIILLVIGTVALILFARGYRPDLTNHSLDPHGILVAASVPDGAQVYINGELKTATNASLSLLPGTYNVQLKRDGFAVWQKNLTIKSEEVTKTDAYLFPVVPDFRPLTFSGAIHPLIYPAYNRLVYAVSLPATESATPTPTPKNPARSVAAPATTGSPVPAASPSTSVFPGDTTEVKAGLWVLDLTDLPLMFSREPYQIVRSTAALDWSKSQFFWSPDGRQILAVFFSPATSVTPSGPLTVDRLKAVYLLDAGQLTATTDLVNISSQLPDIVTQWQAETRQMNLARMARFPDAYQSFFTNHTSAYSFSPDETKLLYRATDSATLPDHLIPPLPGSDTQPQQRTLHAGGIYVFDAKEDRNFWIADAAPEPTVKPAASPTPTITLPVKGYFEAPARITWFPTSRHLLVVDQNKITIVEYDNTNPVTVDNGPFEDSLVFPYPNTTKLIILTNLGSSVPYPNLYALTLR